jgi:hypothetical protein
VGARTRIAAVAVACAAVAATAVAEVSVPVISNFGRKIDPKGEAYDIPEPLMEEQNTARSPAAAVSRTQEWHVADALDEGLLARIQWAARSGSTLGYPRRVGPVGHQWNPCALGDGEEREISRERGEALVAQLRDFYKLQKAHPGLSGVALADRLNDIARRHPMPADAG